MCGMQLRAAGPPASCRFGWKELPKKQPSARVKGSGWPEMDGALRAPAFSHRQPEPVGHAGFEPAHRGEQITNENSAAHLFLRGSWPKPADYALRPASLSRDVTPALRFRRSNRNLSSGCPMRAHRLLMSPVELPFGRPRSLTCWTRSRPLSRASSRFHPGYALPGWEVNATDYLP